MAISPDFLDELERFRTARKRRASAPYQGEQRSARKGEGLTFADYRRYAPGDDPRAIDWKLYGRTEELYVKQYEVERNRTVHVLLDASASMGFGDGEANKFEYAARLGLGFAYLTACDHDEFRLAVVGEDVERLDRARSSRGEVLALVETLNEYVPEGETDFRATLEAYADSIGSRSQVLLASDFLAEVGEVGAALDALSHNEVVLAHVLAPAERDPEVSGDTVFEDPEHARTLRTYFGASLAERYRQRLRAHVDAVADAASDAGARHELIDTGADFFDAFERVWGR